MLKHRLGAIGLALATSLALPAFAQDETPVPEAAPPADPTPPTAPTPPTPPTAPIAPIAPAAPTPTAPSSDGRVDFVGPAEIAASTAKCLGDAKAAPERSAQRTQRNKCLADKRRAQSKYRKGIASFKAEVAAFKRKITVLPRPCRPQYAKGFQAWVADFQRYGNSGGERPPLVPPPATCK